MQERELKKAQWEEKSWAYIRKRAEKAQQEE